MRSSSVFLVALWVAATGSAAGSSPLNVRDIPRHRRLLRRALPSGWSQRSACLSDLASPNRLLSTSSRNSKLTPSSCVAICNTQGYIYAAVQYGDECWCGNSLDTAGGAGATLPASSCNMPCSGDSSLMCGGVYALTLFSKPSSPPPTPSPNTTSTYKLAQTYAGQSFFDNFSFFTVADPTNGKVAYQSNTAALSQNLAYVQPDGIAVMKVDNTTSLSPGANRNSVRITSNAAFNTGLMIFDIVNMPFGCSVWPALWSVGNHWPSEGEIDIIEGVNLNKFNQMTFHTGAGTTCSTSNLVNGDFTGSGLMSQTCASSQGADSGCGFQDQSTESYGARFNAGGGGVFALEISSTGSRIWRFSRGNIPADITAKNPIPANWGAPNALMSSTDSCQMSDVIKNQRIVFDITLCGGWANDAFTQTCPNKGTCADQIANPSNFADAYWKIKSVLVYQ